MNDRDDDRQSNDGDYDKGCGPSDEIQDLNSNQEDSPKAQMSDKRTSSFCASSQSSQQLGKSKRDSTQVGFSSTKEPECKS